MRGILGLAFHVAANVLTCAAYIQLMEARVRAAFTSRKQLLPVAEHSQIDPPPSPPPSATFPTNLSPKAAEHDQQQRPHEERPTPMNGQPERTRPLGSRVLHVVPRSRVAHTATCFAQPLELASGQNVSRLGVLSPKHYMSLQSVLSPRQYTSHQARRWADLSSPNCCGTQRHLFVGVPRRRYSTQYSTRQVRLATVPPASPRLTRQIRLVTFLAGGTYLSGSSRQVRLVTLAASYGRGGTTRQVRLVSVVPSSSDTPSSSGGRRVRLLSLVPTGSPRGTRQARLVTLDPSVTIFSRPVRLLTIAPRSLRTRQRRLVSVLPTVRTARTVRYTRQVRLVTAPLRASTQGRQHEHSSPGASSPPSPVGARRVLLLSVVPLTYVTTTTCQVRLVSVVLRAPYGSWQARLVSLSLPSTSRGTRQARLGGIGRGADRCIARSAVLSPAGGRRKARFPHPTPPDVSTAAAAASSAAAHCRADGGPKAAEAAPGGTFAAAVAAGRTAGAALPRYMTAGADAIAAIMFPHVQRLATAARGAYPSADMDLARPKRNQRVRFDLLQNKYYPAALPGPWSPLVHSEAAIGAAAAAAAAAESATAPRPTYLPAPWGGPIRMPPTEALPAGPAKKDRGATAVPIKLLRTIQAVACVAAAYALASCRALSA